MNEQLETVAVKRKGGRGYSIINKADYDPKKHELHKGKVSEGAADETDPNRNPSGTYSEPTPTDIRYPDTNLTEFENNHGASVGGSAAEIREELGLADAPGGLAPDPDFKPGGTDVTEAAEKGKAIDGEDANASRAKPARK